MSYFDNMNNGYFLILIVITIFDLYCMKYQYKVCFLQRFKYYWCNKTFNTITTFHKTIMIEMQRWFSLDSDMRFCVFDVYRVSPFANI